MTLTRVLIVSEDPLARAGLAAMLQSEDGITVIGQSSPDNGMLAPFPHDIVLFDLGWEADDTLSALASTPVLELDTPLLLLLPSDDLITTAVNHLNTPNRSACYGVLDRHSSAEMVVAALYGLQAGLVVLAPGLAAGMLTTEPTIAPPVERLTPREQDVLNLLAEGLPNKIIARRLTISEYTVKFHVNSILTKLNASSRTEAVVRATRAGLITL
jgi:two-component system, NarL family, nitrate/nitrite response regulator NarL